MARQYGSYLQERDGWYQFLFTIPKEQRARFGGKRQIRKSLGTKDRRQAIIKLSPLVEQYTMLTQAVDAGELTFERAKEAAGHLGFTYRPSQDFQPMEVQDKAAAYSAMLSALKVVAEPNFIESAAITGAVEIPELPVSKLYTRFKEVDPGRVKNKTPEKARKAWKRYETKINEFVKVMGDLDCLKLTRRTVKEYRNKLIERVHNGEFKSAAANEHLEKIRTAWRVVMDHDYEDLNLTDPFDKVEGIDFKDGGKREDFTEEEARQIRSRLEAPDVNEELKALFLIAQNTGCTADELVYMTPDDIVLDHEVPHIKIRPNANRAELKNGHRPRNVPLIGVALEAARKHPNGFPRYCKPYGPDYVSEEAATIIKPVCDKSFYSYRHRIVTLMRNSDCKDQFQNAIMGHATTGMTGYYGGPVWLKKLEEALRNALPEDA
ncbi:DUF6538 domain-containing protein [Sinorhizobium meliloti]|uniref:DUF6538 domain-containing protein n=1 Tax=Rhizobium meliloti TaxID=382 RepID=UPI00299E7792|nr:hypothetical protein [Sinorhizobium meliloti]MDW9991074.1 hypothetical protein [Sinorhizobium meliloti]MDX0245474.1 hypothetical protein [Sinorhizobium meliloti]MDX0401522.1 hypothetical protein [Sinorhizobium meliloti]